MVDYVGFISIWCFVLSESVTRLLTIELSRLASFLNFIVRVAFVHLCLDAGVIVYVSSISFRCFVLFESIIR